MMRSIAWFRWPGFLKAQDSCQFTGSVTGYIPVTIVLLLYTCSEDTETSVWGKVTHNQSHPRQHQSSFSPELNAQRMWPVISVDLSAVFISDADPSSYCGATGLEVSLCSIPMFNP